jgi:hypothetical protein
LISRMRGEASNREGGVVSLRAARARMNWEEYRGFELGLLGWGGQETWVTSGTAIIWCSL